MSNFMLEIIAGIFVLSYVILFFVRLKLAVKGGNPVKDIIFPGVSFIVLAAGFLTPLSVIVCFVIFGCLLSISYVHYFIKLSQ